MAKKKSGGVIIHKGTEKTLVELMSKSNGAHISNKNNKQKNNKPKATQKRGRPPTHGLSKTPAYGSWRNAKQRCNNPKSPQYADYGGRGIKLLLTFKELVDAIGQPSDGETLDRIDPDGHYELSNIRWASRKKQAENRRSSNQYKERNLELIRERERKWFEMGQQWNACVSIANGVRLTRKEKKAMGNLLEERAEHLPRCTWKKVQPRDFAFPPSDVLYLPSLTTIDGEIGLTCYPHAPTDKTDAQRLGVLEGLMHVPLKANANIDERKALKSFWEEFEKKKVWGWCLTGSLYPTRKPKIRPERFLMALAAYMLKVEKRPTLFMPMATLANYLENDELGEEINWAHCKTPWLIIPDLSIDAPKGFSLRPWLTSNLNGFLFNRFQHGLPTIVFIHDLNSIDVRTANIIYENFYVT